MLNPSDLLDVQQKFPGNILVTNRCKNSKKNIREIYYFAEHTNEKKRKTTLL